MDKLIDQANNREQTQGRNVAIVRRSDGTVGIRYTAPNRKKFFIDPAGYDYGGDPKVWSKWPIDKNLSSGEERHYFGQGYICLGYSLGRAELSEILFLIDAWARGFERYLDTGVFPTRPSEAFGKPPRRKKGFFQWLFH